MSKIFGLILVVWSCGAAAGATLQQLSLDQMAQSATAIVRARVVGSSASLTGSTIYTHYKLQTTEVWKGGASAEVLLPGGVAGGYQQTFPGVPALQAGTEYVLFLWTSSGGITHLVGLTQGLFNVVTQADGSTVASRAATGETMLDTNGRQVQDQPVQMQLTALRARVSRTFATGASK